MNIRAFVVAYVVTSFAVLGAASAAAQYVPARLKSGGAPAPPPNTVSWAWDVVDVTVNAGGRPGSWNGLYGTSGWAGFVWKAVGNSWSFEPARDGDANVESHVLIAACYRPAALMTGPDSQPPSVRQTPDVPSPTTIVPPVYPARALGDGAVIVELRIDTTGAVTDARVVQSASGFDQPALDAARQWRFRPAQRGGATVAAYAYLVFGFRQPVSEP